MSGEKERELAKTDELPSPNANSKSADGQPRAPNSVSYFDEWCQVTAWHGVIDYQISKDYVSRILWLCAIGVSVFMALNQTVSLIMEYYMDDQWVTSVVFEKPSGGSLPWPNMSLCSLDSVDEARLRNRSHRDPYMIAFIVRADADMIKFHDRFQAETPQLGDNQTLVDEMMRDLSQKYAKSIQDQDKTFTGVMGMYVRNCTDTVLHCGHTEQFQLHKSAENCCDSSRPSSWSECFTVIPGMALGKSKASAGHEGAIYYLLNPRTQDYYSNILELSKPSAGFRLHLYMDDQEEADSLSTILLAPGTHAMISMIPEKYVTKARQLRTVRLYQPEKVCENETNYTYLQTATGIYSKEFCQKDCYARWSMIECGCVHMDVPLKRGERCAGRKFSDCYTKLIESERNNFESSAFNVTKCTLECPQPCQANFFTTKLSTAKFPAEAKLAAFATYMNRAFPHRKPAFTQKELEQLILLELFYEAKHYRVTERYQRVSVDEFLSNIGGTLGVWMGISLLTLFQAAVYLIKAIVRFATQCFKRSRGGAIRSSKGLYPL